MIQLPECTRLSCWGLGLLAFSCQPKSPSPESTSRPVYDYSVSVEEVAMGVPQTILSVQTGQTLEGKYRARAHAYLFVYEQIYPIEEKDPNVLPRVRLIPQDTLTIVLTRHQTDTIYYLARRVFQPPAQPPARDSLQPPLFTQLHDTDPYVSVRLRPAAYRGPSYVCSGYREENRAGYVLREYLLQLKREHQQHALKLL